MVALVLAKKRHLKNRTSYKKMCIHAEVDFKLEPKLCHKNYVFREKV